MRIPYEEIAERPPVDALAYQARELDDALRPFLSVTDPPEVQQLARLLFAINSWIVVELTKLSQVDDPRGSDHTRALALARHVRRFFAYLRYLKSSEPSESPPAIQALMRRLAEDHLPTGTPEPFYCLVRPKWNYNFQSTATSTLLRRLVKPFELDPNGELTESDDTDEMLRALWSRAASTLGEDWGDLPAYVGVLAFAGLDTEDILLSPLLGHELGHAFDYASPGTRPSARIADEVAIARDDVERALPSSSPDVVDRTWIRLQQLLEISIREALADLVATKMLGLAYFLALGEFLKTLAADWNQPDIDLDSGYPGIATRMRLVFAELTTERDAWNLMEFLANSTERDEAAELIRFLDAWRSRVEVTPPPAPGPLGALVSGAFARALPKILEAAQLMIPDSSCARLTKRGFFGEIDFLRTEQPPLPHDSANGFASLVSAGWAYQLLYGEEVEGANRGSQDSRDEYKKTCRLIHKALELGPIPSDPITQGEPPSRFPIGILTRENIEDRLELGATHEKAIAIVPFQREAIKEASIDVRLGSWFAVARRMRVSEIDLGDSNALTRMRSTARDEHYVPLGGRFVIHPGDFVLGATLEFVGLPKDVACSVEGRSGIGRSGLIVATASPVAPGFRGVLVLELANTGTVPLVLRPGMGIAQVVLSALETPVSSAYRGTFHCQMRP